MLNPETRQQIKEMVEESSATRVVVIYAFGRRADIEFLLPEGARVLRSPIELDELFEKLSAPIRNLPVTGSKPQPRNANSEVFSLPPRRFDEQTLVRLAAVPHNRMQIREWAQQDSNL